MAHPLAPSSTGNSSSSGYKRRIKIYEIPSSTRRELCDHLDELKAWEELATLIELPQKDIQSIKRKQHMGKSPTDELLKIWGSQYNHDATELFYVLEKRKLHQAMRMLKDFVESKYHLLIPKSQPQLTMLLDQNKTNGNKTKTEKILNCSTSSGADSMITTDNNNTSSDLSGSNSSTTTTIKRSIEEYASSILEINYDELTEATSNWNKNFILGEGGFGTVYKGYWKHTDVAIKQIRFCHPDGRSSLKIQLQQSLNELKYLNSCRHDNILPLYGYSIKGEKPCLVYQLMPGGTLQERLHLKKYEPLIWRQRIEICFGTARGINFLHTFSSKPLIHGDIKPANVLLDQCLIPKIGDFGLAREGPLAINSAVEVTSSQLVGTRPYLPPEYLYHKKLSTQLDTYSFGVVLLETFTGLRPHDKTRSNNFLTKHITEFCKIGNNKLEDLIDQRISLLPGEEEMCKYMLMLGQNCIAEIQQKRPDMEHVLKEIEKIFNRYYHQ